MGRNSILLVDQRMADADRTAWIARRYPRRPLAAAVTECLCIEWQSWVHRHGGAMPARQRRPTPRLTGKRDHAAMEQRRRGALVLLAEGVSQSEASRRLGVSRQAVSKWATAKRVGGVKALASKGKPGRKTAPTPAEMTTIEAALLKGPVKNGYCNDLWTLRRVAEVIARVTDRPRPSVSRTWGLLRTMGWSCQRPARRARQQDADAVGDFRERTWVAAKKAPEISGGRSSSPTSPGSASVRSYGGAEARRRSSSIPTAGPSDP